MDGTHRQYLVDDVVYEHMHDGCHHHHHHLDSGLAVSPHRYNPLQLRCDEVAFGTGLGYGNQGEGL